MLVAAFGDSLTTAHNACERAENLALSWATGHANDGRVVSHVQRLARIFPQRTVEGLNLAVSGARAESLSGQVARLAGAAPDYATMLVGGNDLARWLFVGEYGTLLERFRLDVKNCIETLIRCNPRVMIFLAGIPNQSRVLELALRQQQGGFSMPVASVFLAKIPQVLLDSLRANYLERWERANEVLRDLALIYPANVRFGDNVPFVKFSAEHLSAIDFYHPSWKGQKLLAETTWLQGFFP